MMELHFHLITENTILIAFAEDDWVKAEHWRSFAKRTCRTRFFEATRSNNSDTLKLLLFWACSWMSMGAT